MSTSEPDATPREPAVVLLSGGLDSATCAAIARRAGHDIYALTIDYNQRHRVELDCARALAKSYGARRQVELPVDLSCFGGSALTGHFEVPKDRPADEMSCGIPVTYVPARNTVFLSLALAWAEVLGARHIYIGVNALDYSGYPDCRPEFIEAFETMAAKATRLGVEGKWRLKVHTPLITMTKAEIIRTGLALGIDYAHTWSCYDPTLEGLHCGRCDSCLLRKKGFREAGVPDPTRYALP
ncbi:7-cyano-7-deazaguanine synthase QueC [Parapedomonas caeni]